LIFPTHYPEECPPKTAKPVSGEVFRFVNKDTPRDLDFESHFVRKLRFEPSKKCEACGCSVYLSEKAARAKADSIPALRKKQLAKATLSPEWGVIAQTFEPSHHTWWVSDGKKPTTLFKVIKP
jgi:hypothetical protein